jgi:tetratricopeptide (TPR) repeat protein
MQRAGRHTEALRDVAILLREAPQDRELMLISAIGQRNLGRIAEALAALASLERREPRFSRLHQERGLCYLALKDAARAAAAFRAAVNINTALPASWTALEDLCRGTGDTQGSAVAARHVMLLKRQPPEIVAATSLFADGELAPAEQIARAFAARHGDHPEALRLLARVKLAQDALEDAEHLLEKALAMTPDYRAARFEYADTLARRHSYAAASAQLDRLLAQDAVNPDYRILGAAIATGLGRHAQAIALYRGLIRDGYAAPQVDLALGHAFKTIGSSAEAIDAYRAAARAGDGFGDAFWSLANLKTYRFNDDELAHMRREEEAPLTAAADRIHLCFALGKALEDRGEIAPSWDFYARGNALMHARNGYRPETIEAAAAAQMRICTGAFFAARAGWGDPRPGPVFIVGLPRSGSTLLEQILASHSQVDGTQELPDIPRIVRALQAGAGYPAALESLSADAVAALGARYLADTAVHRTGKPFFVDKMPNNFRHIGLIHLMFPNARIIDARREPMACCFSNFKQLFGAGQDFSYSLEDIARYYRGYLALMRHWDEALPGRVLRVHHEDVVAELEGGVRRLLAYCGLDFEPACVAFHKTSRSIATPSAEQVRRPISRDGLDNWRKYEPWLAPLKSSLGDAIARHRD